MRSRLQATLRAQLEAILGAMVSGRLDVEDALEAWLEHAPPLWRSTTRMTGVAGRELTLATEHIEGGEDPRPTVWRALMHIAAQAPRP